MTFKKARFYSQNGKLIVQWNQQPGEAELHFKGRCMTQAKRMGWVCVYDWSPGRSGQILTLG